MSNTMKLNNFFRAGSPLHKISATWLNTITEFYNNFNILMVSADMPAKFERSTNTLQIPLGGINAKGDKTLYKVLALREYTNPTDGSEPVLIDVGNETGGSDRQLLPTWDWVRAKA